MMGLKLMRLPRGANRNRTLGRTAAGSERTVPFAEVEHLFQRFWRTWRKPLADGQLCAATVEPAGGGE